MSSQLYTPLAVIMGLILAATLACQGSAAEKKATKQSSGGPILQLADGKLTYVNAGTSCTVDAKSPLPYRIVMSSSGFSLVTTCGSDLQPETYSTDGTNVRS